MISEISDRLLFMATGKKRLLDICAKAYLIFPSRIRKDTGLCREFLKDGEYCPTFCQIRRLRIKRIKERIKRGGLGIDEEMGIWNSGFISGLRNSGCLYSHSSWRYRIYSSTHKEIIRDLKDANICRIGKVSKNATHHISKFPLLEYPSEKGYTKEFISGLLAGGIKEVIKGEEWIMLVNGSWGKRGVPLFKVKERNDALKEWGILYTECKRGILVSPFYGALFSQWMPVHSACRMMSFRRPALCPKLGILYWDICVGGKGDRKFPIWVDEMPYVGSYVTSRGLDIAKKDLRLEGVNEGILGINVRLRKVMKEWALWHKKNRIRRVSSCPHPLKS